MICDCGYFLTSSVLFVLLVGVLGGPAWQCGLLDGEASRKQAYIVLTP